MAATTDNSMQELVARFTAKLAERSTTIPPYRFGKEWGLDYVQTATLLRESYMFRVAREGMKPYQEPESLLRKYQSVARWVTEGRTPGIIFNGGMGNGKTTTAKALCDLIGIANGIWPCVITAMDYTRAVAQDDPKAQEWAREKLLMIDDIGTEAVSVNTFGTRYYPIAELLFKRYENRRATVCTTNLTHEQFNATYGERVADRVKQIFDWVSFREASYR